MSTRENIRLIASTPLLFPHPCYYTVPILIDGVPIDDLDL